MRSQRFPMHDLWAMCISVLFVCPILLGVVLVSCDKQNDQWQLAHAEMQKGKIMDADLDQVVRIRTQTSKPDNWRKLISSRLVYVNRIYAGTISAHANKQEIGIHGARMSSLMAEWNPIRCSVEEFKSIVGAPTAETGGILEYCFDDGWGGSTWRFSISGGEITGVEYVPGE